MATTTTTSATKAPLKKEYTSSLFMAVLGVSVAFGIPLALVYSFIYYQNQSMFSGVLLLFLTFLLGYICNLLFYRIIVMNDESGKIDKINKSTAVYVLGVTAFGFLITAFTLFVITINPGLVKIFENTIGMWVIGFLGLKRLANEIFYSPTMDPIKDNVVDSNAFNYGFLLSQFTRENVDELIEGSKDCKATQSPFMLDFQLRFSTHDQIHRLKKMVDLKNTAGHYSWIYLSSVVSLFVSMITMVLQ